MPKPLDNWIILDIGKGAKPTEGLVTDFLNQCTARPERRTAAEWLKPGKLAIAGLRDTPATRRKPARRSEKLIRPKSRKSTHRAALVPRRPLLVIDGDSFAHRSYHALPKTILRRGRKPAGAILGFANMLLRLYRDEQPRTVLVAWDTLDVPTYRHEQLPAYQSGREFDDALLGQLDVLPEFVAACGFQNTKAPGFERRRCRQRRKARGHCPHCERRPRHISTCLRPHHHPLSRPRW